MKIFKKDRTFKQSFLEPKREHSGNVYALSSEKTYWLAFASSIVMTRNEDYTSRLKAEAKQKRFENCQPLPDESMEEYYCRVILSEVYPAKLELSG